MLHVELRQFPHTARAFNLAEPEVAERILRPWVSGQPVQWEQRRWAPDRATLTVLSGPELRTEELGMGRGWPNAVRAGENVTEELLARARLRASASEPRAQLKRELLERCARAPLSLPDAVRRAGERWPQVRVSERLALAEQAVWELLHEHRVRLVRASAGGGPEPVPVPAEEWQPLLLAWESWSASEPPALALLAALEAL